MTFRRRLAVAALAALALAAGLLAGCAGGEAPSQGYAHPEVLVDAAWLAEHLDDPTLRIIDVSGQGAAYRAGHPRGAIWADPEGELQATIDGVAGMAPPPERMQSLVQGWGVNPDTTIVFYDNDGNLYAARAYWLLSYYGHPDVRILDGGLGRWLAYGQTLDLAVANVQPSDYQLAEPDAALRAEWRQVLEASGDGSALLLDARSREEYDGQDVRSARGGHIPGARHLDWRSLIRQDGTFESAGRLSDPLDGAGARPDQTLYAYCQTGTRASVVWFVASRLLGYRDVRLYDGSWEEWGNREDLPVER